MEKLSDFTDEELAQLYAAGDNRAFDLLLERNNRKLFSYILFVVHDRDVADDIFQETFVKAICRLQQGRYTDCGKFGAWLMRIAHNAIMDWYRQQKVEKIVDVAENNDLSNFGDDRMSEGSIESQFVNGQVMEDVKRMVKLLPASQREVVFMRFYQKLSFKEIAELTNVSINTALGRMRYAILNLRRMVKKHDMALECC